MNLVLHSSSGKFDFLEDDIWNQRRMPFLDTYTVTPGVGTVWTFKTTSTKYMIPLMTDFR